VTRIVILAVLWGLLGAPLQAVRFPQMPLGGGYECVVILTNKHDTPFSGLIVLREGNGLNWSAPFRVNGQPGSGTAVSVDLPPLGTAKFVLEADAFSVGYLEIVGGDPYGGEGVAIAFFYNYNSNGRLIDSTGIPPSSISRGHLFAVEKSATVDTGFAWAYLNQLGAFDVTLTLYDAAGSQVQQKTVPFAGHLAKFFTEIFDNIPDGFVGHVRITSPQAIGVAVLRLDLPTLQLTSTPATPFVPD
jgi:hypothetical protein